MEMLTRSRGSVINAPHTYSTVHLARARENIPQKLVQRLAGELAISKGAPVLKGTFLLLCRLQNAEKIKLKRNDTAAEPTRCLYNSSSFAHFASSQNSKWCRHAGKVFMVTCKVQVQKVCPRVEENRG